MKHFLIFLPMFLSACSANIYHGDIQRAYKDCQNNGGLTYIKSNVDVYTIEVHCKNSATFTYNSSSKEKYVNE